MKPQQKAVQLPKSSRVLRAIAAVTAREILRDRLLYNSGFFALILVSVSFLAARLSFLSPDRLVVNFGSSGIDIGLAVMAVLLGVQAIHRETDRRTIWVALAHPISRLSFFAGKWIGVFAILGMNWVLLVGVLVAVLYTQVNTLDQMMRVSLLPGLFLFWVQSGVLSAIAMFLASFLTPSLTLAAMTAFYLAGRSVSEIRVVAAQLSETPVLAAIVQGISRIVPDIELFHLGNGLTYDAPIQALSYAGTLLYAVLLILASLFAGGLMLQWKDRSQ